MNKLKDYQLKQLLLHYKNNKYGITEEDLLFVLKSQIKRRPEKEFHSRLNRYLY